VTLQDKRVVVLGGTSGIGLATAQLAADQGATLIVASSNPESVKRALNALPAFTQGEALTLLEVASMDLARARKAFELRYFGALGAVSSALPLLRPGGSIVLTTGAAADRPGAGWSVSASICGAMDSLVRALAVELAPLRVNAVKPGIVRSPLWSDQSPEDEQALYDETAKHLPVGRVGEVTDVAAAYVYLMNQGYATGTIVSVDGGHVLV